jgi:DNA repair protein RecO (recombination protein O)
MQIYHTKGIVLRAIKYGETSIVAKVYTELFGVQTYMVKGVRKFSKTTAFNANYFQSAAILDMQVYHQPLKSMQFIKSFHWSYLYTNTFSDVVRNAVAMYIIELIQHSLKQPEVNAPLFYLIENTLLQLDVGNNSLVSNLPLFFTLHFASEMGFKIQGNYSTQTPILDLKEGLFVQDTPTHLFYTNNAAAKTISQLNNITNFNELENIQLNRDIRRQLLQFLQQYFSLHIQDFGVIKSLNVMQEVLG